MAKRKASAGKAANTKPVVTGTSTPAASQAVPMATTAESTPKTSATTISRKEMLREAALRKRKQQTGWLAAAGAVIVLLIGVAIYISYRNSLPVVGETTFPTQGNLHIPLGSTSSTAYNSTPPTTGPHYEN